MSETIPDIETVRALMMEARLFHRLRDFDPRWVGSIPLNIHGPDADIDIACTAAGGLPAFKAHLEAELADFGADVTENIHAGEASVIARMTLDGIPVEIFGRTRPVEAHESYVHWLAEDRILRLAEDRLRRDIRTLKRGGLKTEPAFAKALGLGGDPYVEMLKLASPGDKALGRIIQSAGYELKAAD
ncbi:DUF4269 domain-containing protein [Maricaulis parjimensis]|uniref:DUF4269 domain-containing protein n=1 Tax=Maricaulis parjimensis TaxID=144023 RepID=UPI001939A23A|nr:DUF4269 domain-containing protein [Maricaulis parjimensis]